MSSDEAMKYRILAYPGCTAKDYEYAQQLIALKFQILWLWVTVKTHCAQNLLSHLLTIDVNLRFSPTPLGYTL